jgi:peptidyl-prolyl cis-trans isomerase D
VLEDGNTSDSIEIGKNHDHMVVVRVAQHLPVKTLQLAQVRDRVLADVQADRRAKAARIAADALLARSAKGESLDAFTSEGNIIATMAVTRDATMVAKPVIDTAFRLPRPVSGKPLQTGLAQIAPDHYALVEVTKVEDGDPKTLDPATRASLRQQATQARGYVEWLAFLDALKREFPVKIAEDRL